MDAPKDFVRIIGRQRYNTSTSTLLADNVYFDGQNMERSGRNTFLYRTAKGAYFTVTLSQWQGERDRLEPCDIEDAVALYEGPLCEHYVSYEAAFPGVEVEEA